MSRKPWSCALLFISFLILARLCQKNDVTRWVKVNFPQASGGDLKFRRQAPQFWIHFRSSWAQGGLCFSHLLPSPTHPLSCKSTPQSHNRCDCFPLCCHGNSHYHLGDGEVAAETNEWPIRPSRKVSRWHTAHCKVPEPREIKVSVRGPD